jgi:hypothetical protein
MSSKRAATSSSRAKKKARAPAPDWRTPLFYWRGKINDEKWSGTWVASDDGLPSDEAFAASANTFKLTCSEGIGMLVTLSEGCAAEAPTATFTGSYKLDNGDGLQDFSDTEHKICLQEGPSVGHAFGDSEWVSVAARGTTEFGEFLSLGKMVRAEDGEHVLTLARRYIADEDPRCAMSAQDALGRISGEDEGKDMWACEEPWLALPWKVPEGWPASLPVPASVLANLPSEHYD